ncbi:hypothetical protein [Haloferax sp. ATB1]|uniref:hypothetical protein n=1 Tax=Haloferax sp. ATB1 TaxID=1508454 RepID=UPI0005B22631|nr:hypothetical protein [Haloferax sp. ATB1]
MRIEPMRPARRAPADIAVNLPLMRLFSVDTSPLLSVLRSSPTVTSATTAATAPSDANRRLRRAAVGARRLSTPRDRPDSTAYRPVSPSEVGVA